MSSHLCVLRWGCTTASGAGWADASPAYLQHLFAGNFRETFKYKGETLPLGKCVEMRCLLLEADVSTSSPAGRSGAGAVGWCCPAVTVPGWHWGVVSHSGCPGQRRAQVPLSAGTEPLTVQNCFLLRLCPFSFRVTWGFFSCFPAMLSQRHQPGLSSGRAVVPVLDRAAGECQTFHCLFASGGGD